MNQQVVKDIRKIVYGDLQSRHRGYSRTKAGRGNIITDDRRAKFKKAKRDYLKLDTAGRIQARKLMTEMLNARANSKN